MNKRLSASAYARHRGVSHVAVLKALKTGRITREADGLIDQEKADAAWSVNTDPTLQRKKTKNSEADQSATPPGGGPSFAQSRAIREAYNARLAKLSYEEKSATLVRTDSVKIAWFNVLRVLRDRTLNLPDRLAPLLAAETDPKAIRELLDNELRQILNDAADATSNLSLGAAP